jgi:ABC-2 type transport system permease protein
VSGALAVLVASAVLQVRYVLVNLFMLFTVLVQPFFIVVTAMFMLRHGASFDPVFVVVGSALTGMWSLVLFDGNWMIGTERSLGTLELLVAAPSSVMLVIAGRLIGTILLSLSSMLVCFAVGVWLFGYEVTITEPAAFVVSTILGLAALWATGLLIAPIGFMSRAASSFLSVAQDPVYIFGGFLFPILVLPTWLHPFSYVLPPFWAALVLHASSSGRPDLQLLLPLWAMLVLSTIASVLIARPIFALLLDRARRTGTLALS